MPGSPAVDVRAGMERMRRCDRQFTTVTRAGKRDPRPVRLASSAGFGERFRAVGESASIRTARSRLEHSGIRPRKPIQSIFPGGQNVAGIAGDSRPRPPGSIGELSSMMRTSIRTPARRSAEERTNFPAPLGRNDYERFHRGSRAGASPCSAGFASACAAPAVWKSPPPPARVSRATGRDPDPHLEARGT